MTTNYLGNLLLDLILGNGSLSVPATLYFALFTSAPTASTGGTEVSGGSYARVAVTNNDTNFPDAVNKSKSNGTAITFPQASAGWGSVVAIGIFDQSSGGNLLMFASFTTPRTVAINDTLSFNTSQITFSAV